MIELGDKVKDVISGFEGIVIGITNWLHGCKRIGVASQQLKDDKPIDSQWFDEPQVIILQKAVMQNFIEEIKPVHEPGGPRQTPQRSKDPKY